MSIKKNENAFPIVSTLSSKEAIYIGLTKREYFAAKAMQGLLSSSSVDGILEETIADTAVVLADDLIKALDDTENDALERLTAKYEVMAGESLME